MAAPFPETTNSRLMNLMTIARMDQCPANDAALLEELHNGRVLLLVPAERPKPGAGRRTVTFTHVYVIDGERTLVAFTSESAIRRFTKEDMCCVGVSSHELMNACMGDIDVIVLDPDTPNELSVCLTPYRRKAS